MQFYMNENPVSRIAPTQFPGELEGRGLRSSRFYTAASLQVAPSVPESYFSIGNSPEVVSSIVQFSGIVRGEGGTIQPSYTGS